MKVKGIFAAALALALSALMGCCQPGQKTQAYPWVQVSQNSSAALFGPTPPPVGLEDRGYFALMAAEEGPVPNFCDRYGYVRTQIFDLQDDLQPNISHHQMYRYTVDVTPTLR